MRGLELAVASSQQRDRKSTRLNSSHSQISYAVFCLKKKKKTATQATSPRTMESASTIRSHAAATNTGTARACTELPRRAATHRGPQHQCALSVVQR